MTEQFTDREIELMTSARKEEANGFRKYIEQLERDLLFTRNKRDRYKKALQDIMIHDYRGNEPTEQRIARIALSEEINV
jgi:hypothetical protein